MKRFYSILHSFSHSIIQPLEEKEKLAMFADHIFIHHCVFLRANP